MLVLEAPQSMEKKSSKFISNYDLSQRDINRGMVYSEERRLHLKKKIKPKHNRYYSTSIRLKYLQELKKRDISKLVFCK